MHCSYVKCWQDKILHTTQRHIVCRLSTWIKSTTSSEIWRLDSGAIWEVYCTKSILYKTLTVLLCQFKVSVYSKQLASWLSQIRLFHFGILKLFLKPQCLATIFCVAKMFSNIWPQIFCHTYLATMHFAAESQAALIVIIPRPAAGVELLFNQVLNANCQVFCNFIISLITWLILLHEGGELPDRSFNYPWALMAWLILPLLRLPFVPYVPNYGEEICAFTFLLHKESE